LGKLAVVVVAVAVVDAVKESSENDVVASSWCSCEWDIILSRKSFHHGMYVAVACAEQKV